MTKHRQARVAKPTVFATPSQMHVPISVAASAAVGALTLVAAFAHAGGIFSTVTFSTATCTGPPTARSEVTDACTRVDAGVSFSGSASDSGAGDDYAYLVTCSDTHATVRIFDDPRSGDASPRCAGEPGWQRTLPLSTACQRLTNDSSVIRRCDGAAGQSGGPSNPSTDAGYFGRVSTAQIVAAIFAGMCAVGLSVRCLLRSRGAASPLRAIAVPVDGDDASAAGTVVAVSPAASVDATAGSPAAGDGASASRVASEMRTVAPSQPPERHTAIRVEDTSLFGDD
jgi:hypothetical protein